MSALDGVRVLELGSFIAGPFAGQLLADHGADVIKVEPPDSGDAMRRWGIVREGESLWWPHIARGKRSVAVDLRTEQGRSVVRALAESVDVVVENFKPGTLERWGLGYDVLSQANPGLVLVRVSGYGQTGPLAQEPGFGSIGEAMGGIRYTTGSPDRPPARCGISLGDSLAAMFAVIGTLAALNERNASGRGQEVDVAIYEAVAALMESTMADYMLEGLLRSRTGSVLPGVAPSNVYPAKDGEVVVAANADAVFARLCSAMGSPELAADDRFRTHAARGANMAELDALIAEWTSSATVEDVLAALRREGVPAGRIYTAADMVEDPHYAARDMVEWVVNGAGVPIPGNGIVPKLSRTPGSVRAAGPALGADTRDVLRELAGLDDASIDELAAAGVVQA